MAGRKDKNTVDYFPHYCKPGKTMYILESKFGNDGYAVWFKLLELFGITENHYIDCRESTDWEFIQAKMLVEEARLIKIIDTLANIGAINGDLWGKRVLWSENFVKNIDDAYSRRKLKPHYYEEICFSLGLTNEKPKKSTPEALPATQGIIELEVYPTFDDFWQLYDKKRGNIEKLKIKWNKISQADKKRIIKHVEDYKIATPDKNFRKDPETYLNNKSWNDEIITKQTQNGTTKQSTESIRERNTGFFAEELSKRDSNS